MVALFSLLIIIVLSIIVVRIGAIALELTGLSQEVATFQAQSAFSGVGFTTSEAEFIVNHPVRRKIIRILILFGSAGLTSTVATFVLTFVPQSGKSIAFRAGTLLIGLIVIYLLARSRFLYHLMKRLILRILRRYTPLRVIDYQEVLGLSKGYTISRFQVRRDSWMIDRSLKELDIKSEGILVFSIDRKEGGEEKFIGVPTADTVIKEGDILLCYGKAEAIKQLSERMKGHQGDEEHRLGIEREQTLAQAREQSGGYS